MRRMKNGGGWAAIRYSLRMANKVGWLRLWKAMRSKNACKTCALGMGGQLGGMRNETGHWPEVCKKSFQAMVADMQKGLEPRFFESYSIDQLKTLTPRELEWCGRLTAPLYAGPNDTHYRVVDWDFAFDRIAKQLSTTQPDENFFYASGRSSNEASFLLQLFARLYGTNYVNNCSFYCHQASGTGLFGSLGTGTATVTLEDVEKADLFFLIGGNPASNHPRLMRSLMTVRRNKGQVIVINPVKEVGLVNFKVPSDVWSMLFGTKIASLYVQPHIGGDMALMIGIAKRLMERNALDQKFIDNATDGFADYATLVRDTSWETIITASGVDQPTIEKMTEMYVNAKNVIFGWCMGITHHEHGVANVQSIVNLALLRGMVGRPKAGVLPIRGHSNIQGVGSMGFTPSLKQQVLDNLEKQLGVELPKQPGLDTMGCMNGADDGSLKSAFCLGGNLYGSNPDSKFAAQALAKLDLVTYLNTTMNTTIPWGRGRETLVLPVLARDEEPEATTQESMFNYVRMSSGGPRRHEGPRSEIDIVTSIALRVLGSTSPVDWAKLSKACHIREMIATIVPGFQALAQIDETKHEFQIEGRTFHDAKFPTPTGKAQFITHPLPPVRGEGNQLRVMTVRSEGQFNTVVYEETDIYRAQDRRNVILMSSEDIARLGLRIDQPVSIRSSAGVMHNILVREWDIRAGNALMYFPEANILVSKDVDPYSKTPGFKSVLVTIETTQPSNGVAEPEGRMPLSLVGK